MVAPPVDAGAMKVMLALALPAVALTPVGAPGAVTVTVGVDGAVLPPPPQPVSNRATKTKGSIFMG